MSITVTLTCPNEDCETEFEAEVTQTSAGCAAKLSGPWEDCYPAEPAEWDVRGPATCAECGAALDDYDCAAIEQAETKQGAW